MTNKNRNTIIIGFVFFCVLLLSIILAMNIRTDNQTHALLEESIKNHLSTTAEVARSIIPVEKMMQYTSSEDISNDIVAFNHTIIELRRFANRSGATYIYAIKKIGDKYYLVYDTDLVNDELFKPYEPADVYKKAFEGEEIVGVMNVQDEYGSFNTAAFPIYNGNDIIGVIGVDIEDKLISKLKNSSDTNTILLIVTLTVIMTIMGVLLFFLLSKIKKMQDRLNKMAYYDNLTQLPNRSYLVNHLSDAVNSNKKTPFAIFFIDLDNFKKVNDSAGHDAGDALLQHIGSFLSKSSGHESHTFRPSAGTLNVAARIGGDEFIIVASNISTSDEARKFGEKLLYDFTTHKVDSNIDRFNVGLSIGASLFTKHSTDYELLLKYADTAMYYAKRAGKNCCRVFDPDIMEIVEEK